MKPKKSGPKSVTFEASIKRLEEIVDVLEAGNISLEESIRLYEEGVELSKQCMEKLNAVEGKLKILDRSAKGSLQLKEEDTDQ